MALELAHEKTNWSHKLYKVKSPKKAGKLLIGTELSLHPCYYY